MGGGTNSWCFLGSSNPGRTKDVSFQGESVACRSPPIETELFPLELALAPGPLILGPCPSFGNATTSQSTCPFCEVRDIAALIYDQLAARRKTAGEEKREECLADE